MQLIALLLLALFPFIGIALLIWMGPRHSWSDRYRRAREHNAVLAAVAEKECDRVIEADVRLAESQRRLRGAAAQQPQSGQARKA